MSYTLFCFIPGSNSVCLVDIDETKTVGHLKDEIKKRNTKTLATVDVQELNLYRVEIGIEISNNRDTLVKELNQLSQNLNKALVLHEARQLPVYFGEGERPSTGKGYYILVLVPEGESIYCGGVVQPSDNFRQLTPPEPCLSSITPRHCEYR